MELLAKLDSPYTYPVAFATGVALHVGFFRNGEWDLYTPHLIMGAAIADGLATFGLGRLSEGQLSTMAAFKLASALVAATLAGVYTSIMVYRAFFHRLNRFPGPFMARLSNFYVTSLSLKKMQLYEEVRELHRQYGDIVRLGPSELSIIDPAAFDAIHSNKSPCVKGPWYNILYPVVSLQMIRDHKEHARRRKTWDKGFSSKALRDYEPRVVEHTDLLLKKLDESDGEPMNMSNWFNFYSFDVMGDLTFGHGFNMLKDGVVHYYMKTVHENMQSIGAFSHLIWIFPLLKSIPLLMSSHWNFQRWLYEHVRKRRENKPEVSDVFSWILDEYEEKTKPTKKDYVDLHGDAELIVVAGSDTTSATLTCLFHELTSHPDAAKKLREEVDAHFKELAPAAPTAQSLSKLEYLQACINETLRLYPPVPSGVQRITPPQGLHYGDTFIPGSTIVQVPTFTLQRDDRLFPRPDEFVPERWTTKTDMVKDESLFAPFSTGRYSCVGKQLALIEIRYVTSNIVHQFDLKRVSSASEFDKGLEDGFTLATPALNISFTKRIA